MITAGHAEDLQCSDALPAFGHSIDERQEEAHDHTESEAHPHRLRSGREEEEWVDRKFNC